MRKRFIVVALFLIAVVGAFLFARHDRSTTIDPATDGEEQPIEKTTRAGIPEGAQRPSPGGKVRLSPELLGSKPDVPNEELWTYSWATRARDPYYEMLFIKKPRDEAKERQLLESLLQIFEGKPDVQVGQIACTADFCRAELLGTEEVDLPRKYGKTFLTALEPKGFRFFLTDHEDPANPKLSFYFGRDASWTVPDFSAELGL